MVVTARSAGGGGPSQPLGVCRAPRGCPASRTGAVAPARQGGRSPEGDLVSVAVGGPADVAAGTGRGCPRRSPRRGGSCPKASGRSERRRERRSGGTHLGGVRAAAGRHGRLLRRRDLSRPTRQRRDQTVSQARTGRPAAASSDFTAPMVS